MNANQPTFESIFGDDSVEIAAKKIVNALDANAEAYSMDGEAELLRASRRRNEGEQLQLKARLKYHEVYSILPQSAEYGTYSTIEEAVIALTEHSGEDYSWMMDVFLKKPSDYAQEHISTLKSEQIKLLMG